MVIRVDAEIIFSIMSVFRVFHLLLHLWLFCNTRTLSYFCFHFLSVSIDVFKAQISTAATAGWKPAEGINIRLLCLLCVVVYMATSATERSFIRRSSTGRKCVCLPVCVCVCVCVSLCMIYKLQKLGRICLNWAVAPHKKIPMFLDQKTEGKITQSCPVKSNSFYIP